MVSTIGIFIIFCPLDAVKLCPVPSNKMVALVVDVMINMCIANTISGYILFNVFMPVFFLVIQDFGL